MKTLHTSQGTQITGSFEPYLPYMSVGCLVYTVSGDKGATETVTL